MSGSFTTWQPTTKNVARTPRSFSPSNSWGVHRGDGPSSKVSATYLMSPPFSAAAALSAATASPAGCAPPQTAISTSAASASHTPRFIPSPPHSICGGGHKKHRAGFSPARSCSDHVLKHVRNVHTHLVIGIRHIAVVGEGQICLRHIFPTEIIVGVAVLPAALTHVVLIPSEGK